METENNFKENFKSLRQEIGIGQIELAKQLGISKGVISLWENGLREPTMTSFILISKYFKVSIDDLIGIE